jgi:RNA polymerase-interacting CarD/CdnL/TRCF family regulator
MGLFDSIFGGKERREREMEEVMNPLLGYRLQHFVAFTADPSYLRHWFSFKNKEGQIEEFMTNYEVFNGHASYLRTHWKQPGEDFFVTLSERGPWSVPITFLIDLGKRLPVNTMSPETHPARNVSPGPQYHPNWKPPTDAAPAAPKPPPAASPYQWQPAPRPAPPPKPPEKDLDGFKIGEAFYFRPLNDMGHIVGIEELEGYDGMIERFVIELDDGMEMKVPVSKLRELMSRKPTVYTDEELGGIDLDDENEERQPVSQPKPKTRITESQGFRTNEFVVYPAHGVGQILAIEEQEIAGAKFELFVINFMKDKMTLRVPTAKVANVGMRKLSEPALVTRTLDTLKSQRQLPHSEWSSRALEYEAKINSGDFVAIAEVVRDLYRSGSQPEQSYSERQIYEAALDRLLRETAVVLDLTDTEAVSEIEAYLAGNTRAPRPVREVRDTTDEELNAIIAPLLNPLADFKAEAGVSYTHIVPAIHRISVSLLVQARGLGPVRKLVNAMVQDLDSRGGMPVRSIMEISKPPVAPELLAQLNAMLWNFVNEMLAYGHPVENVAQAYGALAMTLAERAGQGDNWLFKAALAETLRDLQSDSYGT